MLPSTPTPVSRFTSQHMHSPSVFPGSRPVTPAWTMTPAVRHETPLRSSSLRPTSPVPLSKPRTMSFSTTSPQRILRSYSDESDREVIHDVGCLTLILRTVPLMAKQSITHTQHLPPVPIHQVPMQLDTTASHIDFLASFGSRPSSLRTTVLISLLLLSSVSSRIAYCFSLVSSLVFSLIPRLADPRLSRLRCSISHLLPLLLLALIHLFYCIVHYLLLFSSGLLD